MFTLKNLILLNIKKYVINIKRLINQIKLKKHVMLFISIFYEYIPIIICIFNADIHSYENMNCNTKNLLRRKACRSIEGVSIIISSYHSLPQQIIRFI